MEYNSTYEIALKILDNLEEGGGGGGTGVQVVQTTGQSTTAVMSQKAVTDALEGGSGGKTVVLIEDNRSENPEENYKYLYDAIVNCYNENGNLKSFLESYTLYCSDSGSEYKDNYVANSIKYDASNEQVKIIFDIDEGVFFCVFLLCSNGVCLNASQVKYLGEAPEDGKQYARKDGEWSEVSGGGSKTRLLLNSGGGTSTEAATFIARVAELEEAGNTGKIFDEYEVIIYSDSWECYRSVLADYTYADGVCKLHFYTSNVYNSFGVQQLVINADGSYEVDNVLDVSGILNNKIGDAPSDGKQYARKDGEWSEISGGEYVPAISLLESNTIDFSKCNTVTKLYNGKYVEMYELNFTIANQSDASLGLYCGISDTMNVAFNFDGNNPANWGGTHSSGSGYSNQKLKMYLNKSKLDNGDTLNMYTRVFTDETQEAVTSEGNTSFVKQ